MKLIFALTVMKASGVKIAPKVSAVFSSFYPYSVIKNMNAQVHDFFIVKMFIVSDNFFLM